MGLPTGMAHLCEDDRVARLPGLFAPPTLQAAESGWRPHPARTLSRPMAPGPSHLEPMPLSLPSHSTSLPWSAPRVWGSHRRSRQLDRMRGRVWTGALLLVWLLAPGAAIAQPEPLLPASPPTLRLIADFDVERDH